MSTIIGVTCAQCGAKNEITNGSCWRCGRQLAGDKFASAVKFVSDGGIRDVAEGVKASTSSDFRQAMRVIGYILLFFIGVPVAGLCLQAAGVSRGTSYLVSAVLFGLGIFGWPLVQGFREGVREVDNANSPSAQKSGPAKEPTGALVWWFGMFLLWAVLNAVLVIGLQVLGLSDKTMQNGGAIAALIIAGLPVVFLFKRRRAGVRAFRATGARPPSARASIATPWMVDPDDYSAPPRMTEQQIDALSDDELDEYNRKNVARSTARAQVEEMLAVSGRSVSDNVLEKLISERARKNEAERQTIDAHAELQLNERFRAERRHRELIDTIEKTGYSQR